MGKSIAKEIIIGLLLLLAILLVLAILLYSYIPGNKVVPEKVAYTIPEEAKQVLKETGADDSQVILTYEINSTDIKDAQKTNVYNPGKVNPFSSYQTDNKETTTTTTGGTTSSGTSSTTSNANSSTDSANDGTQNSNSSTNEGTYFKNKGTK